MKFPHHLYGLALFYVCVHRHYLFFLFDEIVQIAEGNSPES